MARLAPLLVLVLVLGACGGGGDDRAQVKQTVRDFVKATNDRDGNRLCDDLVTQEYLEKATGATGDEANHACKQQLGLITGLRLRLIDLGEPKVDGDSASVRATITIGSQRTPRRFALKKEDGSWKLDSGT
jgi:hypothetical protein